MAKFFLADWRLSCIFLVPPSVILYFVHSSKGLLFLISALALVPLAAILGGATEELAIHAGPAAGGLTNATLGNAPELILGFFLLRAGHIEALKASITGSIIGELLLVFGLAVFLGGIGREKQVFNRVAVGASTTMLALAVVGLVMPALFDLSVFGSMQPGGAATERLSFLTALILIGSYFASFIFIFRTHRDLFRSPVRASAQVTAAAAVLVLVVCGGLIAFESAVLVGGIQSVTRALGWTERFVGLLCYRPYRQRRRAFDRGDNGDQRQDGSCPQYCARQQHTGGPLRCPVACDCLSLHSARDVAGVSATRSCGGRDLRRSGDPGFFRWRDELV